MALSPTQLSMRYLRAAGYVVDKAEYWFQAPGMEHGRRRDLFGFVDVVAAGHGELQLVQVTTRSNLMGRVAKIRNECLAAASVLLQIDSVVVCVHGWPKGETKRPVIYQLTAADLELDQELPF